MILCIWFDQFDIDTDSLITSYVVLDYSVFVVCCGQEQPPP